jgi:hypothetical protein
MASRASIRNFIEPPFGFAEMIDGKAWGRHLPRDAVASLSDTLMQFAMPTAFAQEFHANRQSRFDLNLKGPGNYTPDGKEHGEADFTPVVRTFPYAH